MQGAPTETWVVHPHDDPGASVLQVTLFKHGGHGWTAWTGNFTRSRDMELARSVANARNGNTGVSEQHLARDYIAVDSRGRTLAGPFKGYSDAKHAAGPAGHVLRPACAGSGVA